jgi:hypothetical protein
MMELQSPRVKRGTLTGSPACFAQNAPVKRVQQCGRAPDSSPEADGLRRDYVRPEILANIGVRIRILYAESTERWGGITEAGLQSAPQSKRHVYVTQAVLHDHFRYRPSTSKNPIARSFHALAFTFVDKSDSGRDRIAYQISPRPLPPPETRMAFCIWRFCTAESCA